MILGISGKKRHGKDATAACMIRYCLRHVGPTIRLAFADHLKWVAMHTWGLSFEQLYGDEKETVDPRWGLSGRTIMQQLGTEVARGIHPETWVRRLFLAIDPENKLMQVHVPDLDRRKFVQYTLPFLRGTSVGIPDVRFPNEADAVRAAGGLVLRVDRPGMPDDQHASETALDDYAFDHRFDNSGTLRDLEVSVQSFLFTVLSSKR